MSENGGSGRNSDDGDDDPDAPREDGPDQSRESEPDPSGENTADQSEGSDADRSRERRPAEVVSLSLDATLELLADADRRAVLDCLADAPDGTATVADLAEHVADRRADATGERPDEDDVLQTIHHVHVPKLADAGVVDYDPRSREVRYWGSDRLETWLQRVQNDERSGDDQSGDGERSSDEQSGDDRSESDG